MRFRRGGAATSVLVALLLWAAACDSGDEEESRLDADDDDDAVVTDDDDDNDDTSPPGDPCTTTNSFYGGDCGDLPGWEQSETNGCEGACFVMSTPEGNNQGHCVDACESDADCPNNWFCLPECPDVEGWFEIRWCIQGAFDFMRECP